ncbi:MAG: hypothetical protein GY875_09055, partial [Gammaproteobacteria bacterium]|nr:hypothetical protein [Gammaproteobacteria bacterium]
VPELAITIATPVSGSEHTSDQILVSGNFTPRLGAGILVNGVAAVIMDDQFHANGVILRAGSNTLTATLTDSSGESVIDSIDVAYAEDPFPPVVTLLASPDSGLAPLNVSFSLELEDGLNVTHVDLDADGDGLPDQTIYDLAESLQFTYDNPGVYTAEVIVYDDLGTLPTASAVIVVQDTDSLRNHVHAVYHNMLNRLRQNDIDGALLHFTGSRQDKFREIFTLLQDDLPGAVDELGDLSASNISSNYAELIITRDEDGTDYAYFVYLIRSSDGVWRIDGM